MYDIQKTIKCPECKMTIYWNFMKPVDCPRCLAPLDNMAYTDDEDEDEPTAEDYQELNTKPKKVVSDDAPDE